FNREVLGEFGRYFGTARDLAKLFDAAESDVESTLRRGGEQISSLDRYDWDDVARKYEELAARTVGIAARRSNRNPILPRERNVSSDSSRPEEHQ
ncbi:MAG: glycosyl transferase, partial [Sciscionella sp.]